MLDRIYYSFTKNQLKRPVNLIFFVTAKCDSRCIHCFNWQALNKKKNELSLKEIEKFAKQLGKLPSMGFSGGEPFLRKDLEKIISIFELNCSTKNFGIPTNCLRPKQIFEDTRNILQKHPQITLTVYLSLDGTREVHDEIRGIKGAFEKVLETYKLLQDLMKNKRFRLKVTTTILNKNVENIAALVEFVKKDMPDIGFQSFEILRGSPRDKKIKPPTIQQLKELRPTIFESYKGKSFYRGKPIRSRIAFSAKKFVFDTYLELLERKKQFFPCYAGTMNLVLGEEGNLYFCELTPSIGNIREQTFEEIWQGKKAKGLREYIKKRKCWCVHSCFQQNNIVLTKRMWPKIAAYVLRDFF